MACARRREAIMSKTALVLRHVQFEDLGHFRQPLEYAGYEIAYSDLTDDDFCRGDPLEPDLMVILGGPVGVYETGVYPVSYTHLTLPTTPYV